MNQTDVEKIAIFRYGILAPYITTGGNGYAGPYDFFRSAAQKSYTDPITGKEKKFSEATFSRWLKAYQENGFDGLKPKERTDSGQPRKLDDEIRTKIIYYRNNYP